MGLGEITLNDWLYTVGICGGGLKVNKSWDKIKWKSNLINYMKTYVISMNMLKT